MVRKTNILIVISTTVAIEFGVGVAMNAPFAVTYLPIISLYMGAFGVLLHEPLSKSVDAWFSRRPNCVTRVVWLLVIIGTLTFICAIIASKLEPIIWLKFFPDKVPASSSFSVHTVPSVLLTVVCVALYAWHIHSEKNRPSNRRGNKLLSWVIQYLQNETTVGREKSQEYLIELLSFEIKVGRLHLWGRKNNKDVFIRPKDFESKRYVFELHHHEYRLCSPVDETVIWGAAFIEREVTERWPQIKLSASD